MLFSVQALRAFAAWIVVFHHFIQVFFDFETHNTVEYLLATRGQVGVDIFFILSGFVIYLSTATRKPSTGEFLLHRAARIVPAYWVHTLITAAIIFTSSDVMPVYETDLRSLLLSLAFIPNETPAGYGYYPTLPVGWTLNFEMLFYLVFALSLWVKHRLRLWLVAFALIVINGWLAHRPVLSEFYANPILYEFLLGTGVAIVYRRGWLPQGGRMAALLAIAAFAVLMQFENPQGPLRFVAWGLPSAVLVAAFIAMEPRFKGNRACKKLGDWSYSTYLVHVIVLWTAQYALGEGLGLTPYLVLILCIPLIGLLSWLSYEYLEKRFSRHIKRRLTIPTRRQAAS